MMFWGFKPYLRLWKSKHILQKFSKTRKIPYFGPQNELIRSTMDYYELTLNLEQKLGMGKEVTSVEVKIIVVFLK